MSEKGTNIKCLTAENEKLKASASRLAQKRIFSPTAALAAAGGRANCQENVEKLKIELRKAKSQVEVGEGGMNVFLCYFPLPLNTCC